MADQKQQGLFTGGTSDSVRRVTTDLNPDLAARATAFVDGRKESALAGIRKIVPLIPIEDERKTAPHIQDLIHNTAVRIGELNQQADLEPEIYRASHQQEMLKFNALVRERQNTTGVNFDQEQARGITRIDQLAPAKFLAPKHGKFSTTWYDSFTGKHVVSFDDPDTVRETAIANAAEKYGHGYAMEVLAQGLSGDSKALEIQSKMFTQSFNASQYEQQAAESVNLVSVLTSDRDVILNINKPALNMEYTNNLSVVTTLAEQVLQPDPKTGQVRTGKQILADFDTKLAGMKADPTFFPTAFALTQSGITNAEMADDQILFNNFAKAIRADVEALTEESITQEEANLINNRIAIRRGIAQLKLDPTTFFTLNFGGQLNQAAEALDRMAHLTPEGISDQLQFLVASMQMNDQFVNQISQTSQALAQASADNDSEGQIRIVQGGVLQTIDAMQNFIKGGNDPRKVRVNADTLNAAYISFRRHTAFKPAMVGFQTPAGINATQAIDDTYKLFLNKVSELRPRMRAKLEKAAAKQDESLDINTFRSITRAGEIDNPILPTTQASELDRLKESMKGKSKEEQLDAILRIENTQRKALGLPLVGETE